MELILCRGLILFRMNYSSNFYLNLILNTYLYRSAGFIVRVWRIFSSNPIESRYSIHYAKINDFDIFENQNLLSASEDRKVVISESATNFLTYTFLEIPTSVRVLNSTVFVVGFANGSLFIFSLKQKAKRTKNKLFF